MATTPRLGDLRAALGDDVHRRDDGRVYRDLLRDDNVVELLRVAKELLLSSLAETTGLLSDLRAAR